MADWEWHAATKRYRDRDTGRFLSVTQVNALRDQFVDRRAEAFAGLAERLADEKLTVVDWLRAMRDSIKHATLAEYALGRGGMRAMTNRDNGRVGALVKAQYRYLQDFATAIKDGTLSPAQIRARAQLYARAATAAHGRGMSAAYGVTLDRHPGDGHTRCLTNCRCSLRIEETADEVRVTWVVHHDSEACDDCLRLGADWAPLVITKEAA